LKQPLVGTTVKTDGKDSDPYAVLTVLNMHVHAEIPAIRALKEYCISKSAAQPALQAHLKSIFDQVDGHVGLLVSERLVNMPVQIVPHMYRMLGDEMKWAIDDNEPYKFTHYLLVTRTCKLSAEDAATVNADTAGPPSKKTKRQNPLPENIGNGGVFSFHPEDECIQTFATHTFDFDYTNSQPRERDSFGLDVALRLLVIPAGQYPEMVDKLAAQYTNV